MAVKIEVPWGEVSFPAQCASCSSPAVQKTVPIRRLTQAAQGRQSTGYFIGGVIGMAIASAASGPEKYVQFAVPYCEACASRERNLRIVAWLALVVGLLAVIGGPIVGVSMPSSQEGTWIAVGVVLGLVLLIAALVLSVVQSSQRAVRIAAVKDHVRGAVLSFRNPQYVEEFRRLNTRSLLSYSLRAGLPLPVPPQQAIEIISQDIDDNRPDAPGTLGGHFYRGQVYMQMQSFGQAVEDLNKVIAVPGSNPFLNEACFLRGQAFMSLSRYTEAAADLDAVVRMSGDKRRVGDAKRLLKQISSYTALPPR